MTASNIHVTHSHISRAMRLNHGECPIALAIKEFYEFDDVSVGVNGVRVGKLTFEFSPLLKQAVQKFDDGEKVEPFNFLMPYTKEGLRSEAND